MVGIIVEPFGNEKGKQKDGVEVYCLLSIPPLEAPLSGFNKRPRNGPGDCKLSSASGVPVDTQSNHVSKIRSNSSWPLLSTSEEPATQ